MGPQASSAPDMGAGGLAVTQDEVEHPLPSMPCLRAQPDSVATKSKHVANVLSEYLSREGGRRQSQRHAAKVGVRESVLKTVWAPQPMKARQEGAAGLQG